MRARGGGYADELARELRLALAESWDELRPRGPLGWAQAVLLGLAAWAALFAVGLLGAL